MVLRETITDARRSGGAPPATSHDSELSMDASSHDKGARIQDVPLALRKEVAAMHLRSRVLPEEAQELISKLCGWRDLSAAELSGLLRRTQVHVSQKYLAPMIADGRLNYLYPEMIQHPNQKYVTDKTPARTRNAKRRRPE